MSRAFGKTIWIPRSLTIDGTIIRLFDPCNHVEVPPENKDGLYDQLKIDRRWVRIRRPTILVGGELTMDRLEIRPGTAPGVNEAPLQLKSNGGTLVIDDFGRQRMKPEELLNRWIVPLDRRYDFLNLSNGKTIQVPFDQLLIFSTNMQPHDLADEAFLRRIPYKIRALDPTEAQFRELFRREAAAAWEFPIDEAAIDDLIQTHYVAGRPAVSLLPCPRSAAAGQALLRIQAAAAGNDPRAVCHGGAKLFRDHGLIGRTAPTNRLEIDVLRNRRMFATNPRSARFPSDRCQSAVASAAGPFPLGRPGYYGG